jgi:DNA (cytosine-5)-methyltransferase 1
MLNNILGSLDNNSNQRNVIYDVYSYCPPLLAAMGMGGSNIPLIITHTNIFFKVKESNKKGYSLCKIGGVANLSYPGSKTRRGRMINMGETSSTITSCDNGLCRIEEKYKIRKLTPIECWRLMSFSDEDFHKAEKVNSNTQLYKQAGNSIVQVVLMAIFSQMNIQNITPWNELTLEEKYKLIEQKR